MRAVIIATGCCPAVAPLDERYPVPMLPLVDAPFVQRVIEQLAGQGVTQFDLVLSHLPEKLEALLGDGKRWGCRFTYHLARDPERPYHSLKVMSFEGAEAVPVLLGHADRLPLLDLAAVKSLPAPGKPLLFSTRAADDEPWQWTGWALLAGSEMAGLPARGDEHGLYTHLQALGAGEPLRVKVPPPLTVRSFADVLASHRAVLGKEHPGILFQMREADPGVWIARNVLLHPTARIVPPVYLGENSQIGPGVQLGPHVTVGRDSVLDGHCIVANAVIFSGSYVGEGLELADVLVDKNRLFHAQFGASLPVVDDFILGSISDTPLRWRWMRLVGRTAALLGLVLALPVLLLTIACLALLRRGPILHRTEVARLPAPTDGRPPRTFLLWSFRPEEKTPGMVRQQPGSWGNFLLCFLPALVNVARGDLAFVGVSPRTPEEVKLLPPDWQSLYLHSKAGIVTEASVRYGEYPTDDELYAAEGYYAVSSGWAHDLKLLLHYFGRTLVGFLLPRRG